MKPTTAILGVLILAILSLSAQAADPHKLPPPGIHCLRYTPVPLLPGQDVSGHTGFVFFGNTAECTAYATSRGYVWRATGFGVLGGHWRHASGAELYAW